MIMMMMTITMI